MGPLTEPRIPDLPGLEDFEGDVFHSARWNHDDDLAGKRVASIGTGASAIQYVPEIQPRGASSCTCSSARRRGSSRTRTGRSAERERRLYRALPVAPAARARRHLRRPRGARARLRQEPAADAGGRARRAPAHAQPDLRPGAAREGDARATRSAASGSCRPTAGTARSRSRTSSSSRRASREVRARSIVADDGVERRGRRDRLRHRLPGHRHPGRPPACAAAAASCSPTTGTAARAPTSARRSRTSRTCSSSLGPNTGLGHSSMVYMIESQIAHVMAALRLMRDRGAETIEVRADVQERFNAELDRRHAGDGVDDRLRELVPRRERPQLDAVARLDVALPAPCRAACSRTSTGSTPRCRGRARARGRMSARVLITGAAGGIGAAAARELRARGAQVVGLDLRAGDGRRGLRRAPPGVGRPRGGGGDRAARRARRADQQRRPGDAAERGRGARRGRAGGDRREPDRARGA